MAQKRSRPYLFKKEKGFVAVTKQRPVSTIEVDDQKTVDEIWKLIRERHELGVKISQKVRSSGLHAAEDNEPTEVINDE